MKIRRATALTVAGLLTAVGLTVVGLQASPASAAPTRYEAENCTISSGTVDTNHLNYSGTGFVNGDNAVGNYLQCTVSAASAGTATFGIRYANGSTTSRPADISANGTVTAAVNAGSNTIRISATTSAGNPNLDYIDVEVAAVSPVYQAENAVISQGTVATNH